MTLVRAGKSSSRILIGLMFIGLGLANCSKKNKESHSDTPVTSQPEKPGVLIPSGIIPTPSDSSGQISYLGGVITTQIIAGKIYIPIEATFSDQSFVDITTLSASEGLSKTETSAAFGNELLQNIKTLKKSVRLLNVRTNVDVGFFSALLALDDYPVLASIKDLSRKILINPVIEEVRDPSATKPTPPSSSNFGIHADKDADGRSNNAHFSGLERIGTQEFLSLVKTEIGEDVDGSLVKVGVTDTGITYNHPSFFDKNNVSRITYMKDFTGEGLIYFPDTAEFAARTATASEIPSGVTEDEVAVVTAKFIMTPVGRAVPVADKLSDATNQVFLLPKAVRDAILTPNSGARLGALSENAYSNVLDKEFVDINRNGKKDDVFMAILLPNSDASKTRIYIDFNGKGDFRKSPALGDFNSSKTLATVFSEKVGLHIKSIKLAKQDATEVNAIAAAIVGFDPGNHGSHVAGIIAGRKTIANDAEDTLARGVAPNAKIMMDRVCANNGGCTASEAIVDLATSGAEVINMSLGGLNPWNDGYGVQETIVNRLSKKYNTVFVISAGNSGPGRQTVGSPSVTESALSVAATATKSLVERQYQYPGSGKTKSSNEKDEDFVLFFSSRGPTAGGGFKPNISAPGTELSAVQLNSPAGQRSGLDVYWGTSMAAPTASGAITLLIDAAKRFNAKNPANKLPLDNTSLRRAIIAGAKPFDVQSFSTKTKKSTRGQYTWIDQGHGMINLPQAWKALKAERDLKLPSPVTVLEGGKKTSVDLEYEVRVLRTNPNGNDYSGSVIAPTQGKGTEPRFGRGIYLDMKTTDSLIGVQIARRLPLTATSRPDVGDLQRQLVTTADTFELETTMYGSNAVWLKAGTLGRLDCQSSPTSSVTVIGAGAIDDFNAEAPSPASIALAGSNLNVCLNRSLMATLPPGDHGALIKAFRVVDGKKEPHASFIVPVYLTVPHGIMAGNAAYDITGVIKSFGVDRNYVDIPSGVSLVKVSIEVPEAQITGNVVKGCSGVELMILEGANTAKPAELSPRAKARATNCDATGAISTSRKISYTRFSPKAGVWDVHVFGLYAFAESPYKLTVEFANVSASKALIGKDLTALNDSLEFIVGDASLEVKPSSQKSTLTLSSLEQKRLVPIKDKEELQVPDIDSAVGRTYDASVGSVTFSTSGLSGSDLDMNILECQSVALDDCKVAADSAGPTDEESATITPIVGKFYVPVVIGYSVESDSAQFHFVESKKLVASESGSVAITPVSAQKFTVEYKFDIAVSKILQSEAFTSKKWSAAGNLSLNSDDGAGLIRVPVEVVAP